MMEIKPLVLSGQVVRLEPLEFTHSADLLEAGREPEIWRYLPEDASRSEEAMRAWIERAQREQQAGTGLPFAIIDLKTHRAIGSTRYQNIIQKDRGLEIGWTWLGASARRTGINTECKYMLLRHAFEELGTIRVQLKTDSRNTRSQRAIERIGAKHEGILRNHMIMPDGYYRDSVYYSIIEEEWTQVRSLLETLLRI
jgi:RimJ/RimL family protein N-acetyltransferase